MKIGIDAMGGDFAPKAVISGAILAQQEFNSTSIRIVLVGDEKIIQQTIQEEGGNLGLFDIVHAPDVIGMGEHPTKALSHKPQSSIAVGFSLLKQGKIDSFASAGNTGSMLVGSMFSVKSIAGVIRPCITSVLPKEDGGVGLILDVGTNADCKPDVLYQFGMLGSILAKSVYKIENPKVGLLNIGEEAEKGNLVSQAAHALMKDSTHFNFIGNVEGRDLFSKSVDVIVCDGFTGNVVLKEAEAFYTLIKRRGRSDEFFDRFNYENYGGTPILGVNSNVLIGHGISNSVAIKNMLLLSKDVILAKLPEKIKEAFN
ncbi:MAG: phosphate acyltransferase PlsX [Bacteroidetes bacterium]|nr:phosphate acyltransferase PlsX [Bacteroidota bacterium]MBK9673000.1 phosphate acyltransferase PlsX [Bacteroidota bacterium]MBK9799147.1 phosphate acyltransferase PlsX [Bacteroidota bacterium]MBP6412387.1 phosphate acyltransferase PlsX [Bacteroidia bacterium]